MAVMFLPLAWIFDKFSGTTDEDRQKTDDDREEKEQLRTINMEKR